ncbi:MAG: phosphodiester glycosidase family protein [Cyanothece sp. SIO1E1]|nr:phosphodiester glycosidase family protein [Cyanothece sp. SIO1E1]
MKICKILPAMTVALLSLTMVSRVSATALETTTLAMLMAQIAPLPPLAQRGERIRLNGRVLPGVWSQSQRRVGITDLGLANLLGLKLLDTNDTTQQPVQWFSQPTVTPIVLPAWLAARYRYLDITSLATQANWQVKTEGTTLQITTPPARVMSLRQGRQTWGDRIVVDLDQPTPWQIAERDGEWIITVDAAVDPSLVQNFEAGPGNLLTALDLSAEQNQVTVRVGVPASFRPRVFTLNQPNRLVIDIRPDSASERNIHWAPGLRWQQRILAIGNDRFPVTVLAVDPKQTQIRLKPIWSNSTTVMGISPLITTARNWQAIAAINGGFFNRNNQLPLGAIRRDQRWLSGPILNRGAIAWNDTGEILIDRLSLQEFIRTESGQRFPITTLNSGYVKAGMARYTSSWGPAYKTLTDHEIVITVQNDQVVSRQTAEVAGRSIPIPANGYVLPLRSYATAANSLDIGTRISLETKIIPDTFERYPQILGAGPLLIQNGRIVLDAKSEQFSQAFIRQAAPRSAIGQTVTGLIVMVTAHNRIGGSGPTLGEIAQIMQRLGTVQALNLDGGSSTSLYLGGQLLNRPPRTAARVHNAIGVFIRPPE